jgi:hypothetical protein
MLDELAKRELVEEGNELEKVGLLIAILEELVAKELETEGKELESVELLILVLQLVNDTLDFAANALETAELLPMVLEKLAARTFDVAVKELVVMGLIVLILEVLKARVLDMAVNGLSKTELLTLIIEGLVPRELDIAAVEIERTELIVCILSEEDKSGLVDRTELDRKGTEEDGTPDEERELEAETIDEGEDRPVEKFELEARGTGDDVSATEELKDPAIRELLDSGTNSKENVDDESGRDGDTSIVEEALFRRIEKMVGDCNGSVAMLEAIETTMRVLEVGINPEDIDNAEVNGSESCTENDVAIGNVITEVVTLDTPKTLEIVLGISRLLEEGIIQCVENDGMETSEELDGGPIVADVVTDD